MATKSIDAPVLIAGGGLVGLSEAMFLARYGIPATVLERLRGVSALPRAAHFHLRTLEMFRSARIEDEVRRQSQKEFMPEGAIVALESLAGKQIAAFIPSLNEGVEALSPCRRLFITQPGLEPILRKRAERAGARVLDGLEVIGVEQDADSVTVVARDVDSGRESRLTGRYLLGADGAHSKVRELMNIPFEGRGVFSNSITIYFRADVARLMEGRNLSVMYIINPTLSGFIRLDRDNQAGFLVVNTVGDTSKPETGNAAADTSEKRLLELLRAGIGVPDCPVHIEGVARWRSVSDLARHYQVGRVFMAGDAAHVMPPNGGFGGNTGIADAHNLAWKLALVLRGLAGPRLLTMKRSAAQSESSPSSRPTRAMSRVRPRILAPRITSRRSTISTSRSAICIARPPSCPTMTLRRCTPIRIRRSHDPARVRRIFGSRRTASASPPSISSAMVSRCWRRRRAQPGVRRLRASPTNSAWRSTPIRSGGSFATRRIDLPPRSGFQHRAPCWFAQMISSPGAQRRRAAIRATSSGAL
jgi:2-polyprenyl-6-methoxyphenol hydroxylase-like FAD-dependent oxidoreductase